jgi:hypothetical protein
VIRLLAAALLLAGCAATGPREGGPPGPPGEEQELVMAYDELRRLDKEFRAVDMQLVPPDCARVAQLRDNICALATRICHIAERPSAGSLAAERCRDGKTRCKNAVDAATARGCPQK